MSSALITDWSSHNAAFAEILGRATQRIDVFDGDLTRLPLERPEHTETLRQFLARSDRAQLRIVLRDPAYFRRDCPRLMKLLTFNSQKMFVTACPEQLASMNDSLVLIDGSHGLVRFHEDNVRSKRIDDDPDECKPYILRFSEILREGGEPISPTPAGL